MEYYSKQVKEIVFNIKSPEQIKRESVVHVTSPELYSNNAPNFFGLFDPRMGPYDNKYACKTCKQNYMKCPGHFGHIEMAVPVYFVQFMGYLKKMLGCICFTCSGLLFDKTDAKKIKMLTKIKSNEKKLQYIANNLTKECMGCGRKQPKFVKDGLFLYVYLSTKSKGKGKDFKKRLWASKCLEILSRLTQEDAHLMGFVDSRPEWMICQNLPVPPPCIRPSVKHNINLRSEDDFTYKMLDIIKANNELLQKYKKNNKNYIDDYIEYLQYHVTTLIDNDIRGVQPAQHRSGRVLKAYKQKIKGKDGRIRGNLMGKRVNFSGRSVISPDPTLRIDEIGVPKKMAKILTIREMVTDYNIEELQKYVYNGVDSYPGAKFIVKKDGDMIDLKYAKHSDKILVYGMQVGRHLMDGDILLFNRQPSLHKMSMMAHIVKIIDTKSFRFNPNVCNPYNADFDGDEMNIFVPQSVYTMVELKTICHVPTQIITPQANKPVIGAIMDTVVGASHITLEDTKISFSELQNILGNIESYQGNFNLTPVDPDRRLYSGRDVMSMILPKINYTKSADEKVQINNGQWTSGLAKKDVIGASSGSLIHIIANDIGVYDSGKFLNEVQRVANTHLLNTGFSVSLGDCIMTPDQKNHIKSILSKAKADVNNLIQMTHAKAKSSKTIQLKDEYENKIFGILNKARDDGGKFAKENLKQLNGLNFMVNIGSKGNYINICQITSCVGQQGINDKMKQTRVPYGLEFRTAPHFEKFDDGPESRGFISRSYVEGLKPHEMFFHMMAGREGLIDTAVKTSETGYIQRRLIKAMEDVKVHYDGTVRNEVGTIIQFVYGSDGFDGKSIERQYISHILMTSTAFQNKYKWKRTELKNMSAEVKSRESQKVLDQEYKQMVKIQKHFMKTVDEDFVYLPININRIIQQSKKKYSIPKDNVSDLNPIMIIKSIETLISNLKILYDDDEVVKHVNKESLKMNRYNLKSNLASKKIILDDKLSEEAFKWVLRKVEEKFYKAVIHPGEMCGPIAAQSIGERTTQLTLNTFHSSGVSSKTKVNQGVPRLREIISATKNPKTPSMTIFLEKEFKNKKDTAKEILNKIQYVNLMNFVTSVEIWYDPNPRESVIEKDSRFLKFYYTFDNIDMSTLSPWTLRIEVDHQKLYDKQVDMYFLYQKISKYFGEGYHVIYSDDNADTLVFYLRKIHTNMDLKNGKDDNEVYFTMGEFDVLKRMSGTLENIIVMGVKDVDKVFMREHKTMRYKKDGTKDYRAEYVLDTVGSNLRSVLNLPNINPKKTVSNQIHEVYQYLGIEAARNLILREINGVLKSSGIYLNQKHLYLLCDIMTNKGHINTIDRHGMNKSDTGPLARCSFEETDDQLTKAAIFNQKDTMSSIASSLIMGQIGNFGTGMVELDMELEFD